MRLSLFIAWRYFFSRRKLKVINIISLIALVGIAVTTCALFSVLSVFNGFTQLSEQLLSSSSAPLVIEAKSGKTFKIDTKTYNHLIHTHSISICSRVIRENAIVSFGDNQTLIELRGVEENYNKINNIDTAMLYGSFHLFRNGEPACVVGVGVASSLMLPKNAEIMGVRMSVMVPNRFASASNIGGEEVFINQNAMYSGCFETKSEIDEKTVFVPLSFAQELLSYQDDGDSLVQSSIYIKPANTQNILQTKEDIEKLTNSKYEVKDILAQQPIYGRVVKMERFGVYLILSFIIFIATFNIMGSLSLLIMDKKRDMFLLESLGARQKQIRQIYFLNGFMLSIFGAAIGLILGLLLCFVQQRYGLIKMSSSPDVVINAFPVQVKVLDMVKVFLLTVAIGLPLELIISHKVK